MDERHQSNSAPETLSNPSAKDSGDASIPIDTKRYRRVRRFFFRVFLHIIWWEVFLNRPYLQFVRQNPAGRRRRLARHGRMLAVEMGGVLIKLGQFLSIRVDVLPREITKELSGLQDEVPAESADDIIRKIETAFMKPVSAVFAEFNPEPIAAASLAQVHAVRLKSGMNAVIKVLRPDIRKRVETDLAVLDKAMGWLKRFRSIRKRLDPDWLFEEFATVTRREMDFREEAKSMARIENDFYDYPGIYVPKVYSRYTHGNVLVMEDVRHIKIDDIEGLKKAGVVPAQVAQKLHEIYMRQVFETFFVHADPHPGNLFVEPLKPDAINASDDVGTDSAAKNRARPFRIVFVDFGMTCTIPERLRGALREYAIGLGTRDAERMVKACADAGTLQPDADLRRLVEIHEIMLRRLWGVKVGRFQDLMATEIEYFLKEFRDIIYEAPIQFQADMLFIIRAVGMLSGLATHLDPEFDPWNSTIPFAEQFAKMDLRKKWKDWRNEAESVGRMAFTLPSRLDRVLKHAEQGTLRIESEQGPIGKKQVNRLLAAIHRLSWTAASAALLISGAILYEKDAGTIVHILLWGALAAFFIGLSRR